MTIFDSQINNDELILIPARAETDISTPDPIWISSIHPSSFKLVPLSKVEFQLNKEKKEGLDMS